MADLVALPLLEVSQVADRQVLLRLDTSSNPAQREGHKRPGQYVQAALYADDVPRPYALANAPGTPHLELLIKAPADRLARLIGLQVGERLKVSKPEGPGYDLDAVVGCDLWFIGVGSGIAPLRAALDTIATRRQDFGEVHLLYGVRHERELCFTRQFGTWAGLSMATQPVVSSPSEAWDGARGRVTGLLPAHFKRPAQVRAIVCGLPEMERDVQAALLSRGVAAEQVLRNW